MDTKLRMIESFLKMGTESGFDNLSLSKITDSVDIKKASFYSHFNSFSELEDAAVEYCLDKLAAKDFKLNTKAGNMRVLLEYLFGDLYTMFTEFPVNALYSISVQKKTYDRRFTGLYNQLEMMVNARILVALDFCVQHSWTNIKDTDSLSLLLSKAFLSNPDSELADTAISLM